MPEVPLTLTELLGGIDRGIQAHLGWNQRLLRCALMRELQGDDMLLPDAYRRCQLGIWLEGARASLAGIEPTLTAQVFALHEAMHGAVRSMCLSVHRGDAVDAITIEDYEHAQSPLIARLGELRERIAALATQRDPLTGLPLRHDLAQTFELRQRDARRDAQSLHLAMIDIDRFKSINDRFGHLTGDAALAFVATQLRTTLRESDVLIRYGGEEFLVLMLNAHPDGAETAARRLRDAVRAATLQIGEQTIALSITIGLTQVGAGEKLSDAIDRADQALLEGKRTGRDRVVVRGA